MKNIKKMLCVLLAVITVLSSLLIVPTSAKSLKSTQITSVSILTTGIRIKWNAVKGVSGYQIQTARSKDFKKNKTTFNVAKPNASAKRLRNKDLKAFKPYKKYYVRIRTYKKSGKKTAYSKWSAAKSFKTPNLIEMEDHTYVVCTTNDNHQCVCGNVNGWFKSRDDLVDYIQNEIHYWSVLEDKDVISWDEYLLKAPTGYECWSCGFCGKWTGNMYYHDENDISKTVVKDPSPHIY